MRDLVFIFCFVIPSFGFCPREHGNPWTDKITQDTILAMQQIGCKHIDKAQIKNSIESIWEASKLNPSWGTQKETTIKFVAADYGESGFVPKTINLNRNGTVDFGELEINSCNWYGKNAEWLRFCRLNHLNPKNLTLLFSSKINTMFAAHLNECFIHCHQDTYHYDDRWDKKFIYQALLKDLDEPLKVADK